MYESILMGSEKPPGQAEGIESVRVTATATTGRAGRHRAVRHILAGRANELGLRGCE